MSKSNLRLIISVNALILAAVGLQSAGLALVTYSVRRLNQRVEERFTAYDAADRVPFPAKIVFRKSEFYAPCIAVGTQDEPNILWKERATVLANALNSDRVRTVLKELGASADLKFRYEQHHPTTLEIIDGNMILWADEVNRHIPVLNHEKLQAALQQELAGVRLPFPKFPDPGL